MSGWVMMNKDDFSRAVGDAMEYALETKVRPVFEAKDAEIALLRSHVSRLEESLRVALEARAEAVEVLTRSVSHGYPLHDYVTCKPDRPVNDDRGCPGCQAQRIIGLGDPR